jgi:hypothetical protein
MSPDNSPRMRALRVLLMMDATVLLFLGAAMILAPQHIETAFHFEALPPGVSFILALWGAALFALGIGSIVAATDPARYALWVVVGIARGGLEALAGGWCLARGFVTWPQSGFGILLAALLAAGFAVLYPRPNPEG